jgi:hypothetical protein
MKCRNCGSEVIRQLPTEANVHFVGANALNTPALLIFPYISVCLECGFTEMKILDAELKEMRKLDAFASS